MPEVTTRTEVKFYRILPPVAEVLRAVLGMHTCEGGNTKWLTKEKDGMEVTFFIENVKEEEE